MNVPFVDLSRQYIALKKPIDEALGRVMASGRYILGQEVEAFEKEFARYIGVNYAIGTASGTESITLALWGLGLGRGDGVIVSANSLPSVWGVLQAGCRPVLVDIDPQTFNLDPVAVEAILKRGKGGKGDKGERKIKAILAVHLYGRPAPIEEIMKLARRFNVKVIEDCAQACGAEITSKVSSMKYKVFSDKKLPNTKYQILNTCKVGNIGDIGIFSFYPTKNLGGYGDGGMVLTNDKHIAERVKILRMYGEKPRYTSQIVGINSRLDELQAAILRVKLPYVDGWNRRRREIADKYLKLLRLLKLPNHEDHVYHLYVIRTSYRDRLRVYLAKQGIETMIHYPLPIHLQPSLKFLGYNPGDFPLTEKATSEILSLPLYPELKDEEVEEIFDAIDTYNIMT